VVGPNFGIGFGDGFEAQGVNAGAGLVAGGLRAVGAIFGAAAGF